MKKKICITTNEFPPEIGGVGVSVDRISKMLSDYYEVHIVLFDFEGVTQVEGTKASVYSLPCYDNYELEDGRILHRVAPGREILTGNPAQVYQQFYTQLRHLHQKYSFAALHSFYISSTGFISGLVAKENSIPFIASIRGNDIHLQIFSQRLSQIKWTLENADIVTSVSRELANLANIVSPCVEKTVVIRNSINRNSFDDIPPLPVISNLQRPVIGTAGVFKRKKGLEYLLEACKCLDKHTDYTLLLAGFPIASEEVYWSQIFKELSSSMKIQVTGKIPHKDILSYLNLMDVFVISSVNDGFPNTLLEAMFIGKPIISTRTAAMQEVLEHGNDSLLIDPGSVESLSTGLITLLRDADLGKRIGKNAELKVQVEFSSERESSNWINCYNKLLND